MPGIILQTSSEMSLCQAERGCWFTYLLTNRNVTDQHTSPSALYKDFTQGIIKYIQNPNFDRWVLKIKNNNDDIDNDINNNDNDYNNDWTIP